MATCPNCGASSRTLGAFTLERVLQARRVGDFSLAGRQMKISAVMTHRLSCRCGWSICGTVGDDFLGDPTTQVWPEADE